MISDALGVVVLEIGNRWVEELSGKRAGRVLDLMLGMWAKNTKMVFWRNLQDMFPVFANHIARLKENLNAYGVALIVHKILKLLENYFGDEHLKEIKLNKKAAE